MDRLPTSSSSSQLSSVSSTSSLPSLSGGSVSDSDARPEPSSSLRPQESTSSAAMSSADNNNTSAITPASQLQRPAPFKSFRSLQSSGPFNPLTTGSGQLHVVITATIALASLALSNALTQQNSRQLEDSEWTGEWNGEWTANDDADYESNGDDDDSSESGGGGMWLNDPDPDAWSPEQIITYVSIGLLSFMTLLCCVCYPEILIVGLNKLCGCCGLGALGRGAAKEGAGMDGGMEGGDYVGGAQQDEKRKKKRRGSKTKRERSSSRNSRSSRASRDREVELV